MLVTACRDYLVTFINVVTQSVTYMSRVLSRDRHRNRTVRFTAVPYTGTGPRPLDDTVYDRALYGRIPYLTV